MTRRTEKINELLRKEISQLLSRQVKDPNLDFFVTVTEVVTSADLSSAKVYISVMANPEERAAVIERLSLAAGFFRKELSSYLPIRRVPELSFRYDDTIERGAHLLQLLDQLAAEREGERKGETRD